MTKTPNILGYTPCPICPIEAEVRTDRHGLAYIYCAHGCHTQVFTRDKHRDGLLRARMRPVAAAAAGVAFVPSEAAPLGLPVPAPAAQPVPAVPSATPAPSSSKPRSTWLTTLLDKAPAK